MALHAFGWLVESKDRKLLEALVFAGTDNLANEALSAKRSTTKWPLMAVNMQLSASLSKARLSLGLKWRPREENIEADSLTNEIFTGFEENARIRLKWEDLELGVLNALVHTRAQFDTARESAREAAKLEPKSSKKRYDKSQW